MTNKSIALSFVLLLVTGCSEAPQPAGMYSVKNGASAPRQELAEGSGAAPQRFIAVAHRLVIETAEAGLVKAWEATVQFCRSIRCEVISSSINNRTEDSPPSGSLSLRVVPEDLKKLFDHLGKAGSVLQHMTESEDKTAVVIDVEAKLKNLTDFRDRLRAMLAKGATNLKDVIEVERELSRVQAELDSLATRRRVLANETEKVAVRIDFRPEKSIEGTAVSAPIARAWRSATHVFSESTAALLTFIFAVIPWLLVLVPLFWISGKLIRKVLRRRAESRQAS